MNEFSLPRDPFLLLSFVNTKLRDVYPSFTAFCEDLSLDGEEIQNALQAIGYQYSASLNQFV